MEIELVNRTELADSYRQNRVRSLMNVTLEQASTHRVSCTLPLEEQPWRVGLVVGPSGSGKTTLGRKLGALFSGYDWADDRAIIDEIGPDADLEAVEAALASVGLGTVPAWLRPYRVLSGGERFRADLARLLVEADDGLVVYDEFTSVVDRQVAQLGAAAFAKGWRRKPAGRFVALACHYDIADWLQPDWVLDTADWTFSWRSVQRPPSIRVDVHRASWSAWPTFKPHHYLDVGPMMAAYPYVGLVGGQPVAHLGVTTFSGCRTARICRLVVMPEWQGAGVGMRFLEHVAQQWLDGVNHYNRRMTSIIHTSHPGLVAALQRRPRWVRTSARMGHGRDVTRLVGDQAALAKALGDKALSTGRRSGRRDVKGFRAGYGGHTRAVSGFRYVGDR